MLTWQDDYCPHQEKTEQGHIQTKDGWTQCCIQDDTDEALSSQSDEAEVYSADDETIVAKADSWHSQSATSSTDSLLLEGGSADQKPKPVESKKSSKSVNKAKKPAVKDKDRENSVINETDSNISDDS